MNWSAKMAFNGGGRLKKHAKSNNYLSKLLDHIKIKETNIFRSAMRGSVLIEFAVCMPVLIILLYYVNDLSKLKRYYDQTEFVAQQMVNILQNISQNRAKSDTTNTEETANPLKIREDDVKYAASLAYLTIYPGKTMYADGKRGNASHGLSHAPCFYIHYVKSSSEGTASVLWSYYFSCCEAGNPTSWQIGDNTSPYYNCSVVKRKIDVDPKDIYPTLKMNGVDDVKIIIECPLFCGEDTMSSGAYAGSDNQDARAKKAFNCMLATPGARYRESNFGFYFPSVVIFSPIKRGLFDENGLEPPK